MSHNPERSDKNCLNCGATVAGRYCQRCGQENIETRESFWSLVKHFVYDILHFDGKFFYTLKYIFTRPGFVAAEYVRGKRTSYLHPIRMYLFTSAVFFLIFFSLKTFSAGHSTSGGDLSKQDRRELAEVYEAQLKEHPADSFLLPRIALLSDTTKPVNPDSLDWGDNFRNGLLLNGRYYASPAQYDSVQQALPAGKKDNWMERVFIRQSLKTGSRYGKGNEGNRAFTVALLHKLPYMLFVSLPFFAGLLKLLYVRRKNFYYSDHAVFTLYHYIFSFILLLVGFLFDALRDASGWRIFTFLIAATGIVWPVYLFIEMRRFYGQGFGKTLLKFLLLNVMGFVLILALFIFFLLFSFLFA